MKTPLIACLALTVILPALAVASVASDQANRTLTQPLSSKLTTMLRTGSTTVMTNDLGQSAAMTQAMYKSNRSAAYPTVIYQPPQAMRFGKPEDW